MIDLFAYDFISEIECQQRVYESCDIVLFLEDATGAEDKKEGALSRIINALKKALIMVKTAISNMLSTIGNKVRYAFLSKEQKGEYDRFCSWVKTNPGVRKKTITVKDWNRITREYDKTEKKIVDLMNDQTVDANGFNLKARDLINNLDALVGAATATLTVDAAMFIARKSPEAARKIQEALQKNQGLLATVESQIGDKEALKLQKNINRLTKETAYHRIMAKFFDKKSTTFEDAMKEYLASFKGLMTNGNGVKTAIEHRSGINAMKKSYLGDKRVRKGIKQAVSLGNDVSDKMAPLKEFINPKV